jgi:hypothetical protein
MDGNEWLEGAMQMLLDIHLKTDYSPLDHAQNK